MKPPQFFFKFILFYSYVGLNSLSKMNKFYLNTFIIIALKHKFLKKSCVGI